MSKELGILRAMGSELVLRPVVVPLNGPALALTAKVSRMHTICGVLVGDHMDCRIHIELNLDTARNLVDHLIGDNLSHGVTTRRGTVIER